MKEVDDALDLNYGLTADGLPDVCYRDWYDDGVSPKRAAARAVRSAQE